MTAEEREEYLKNMQSIKADVEELKKSGRVANTIQVTAILLLFFFGVQTIHDARKKFLR